VDQELADPIERLDGGGRVVDRRRQGADRDVDHQHVQQDQRDNQGDGHLRNKLGIVDGCDLAEHHEGIHHAEHEDADHDPGTLPSLPLDDDPGRHCRAAERQSGDR
jgi:hypothetical protein